MISDILFDAVCQIRTWQDRHPELYEDWEVKINAVTDAMSRLRCDLDASRREPLTVPTAGVAAYEAMLARLAAACLDFGGEC